jgi:hypothetical protein
MTSMSCRTPGDCSTPTAAWRRLFHWPLFCVLAAVHLTLLPLLLGEDDRVIAVVGGLAYLVLAALDWRRRTPAAA